MTSGFKTADGKDLDDLFYIDNGNAGALGFLYAGGADLGNAYTNKSVLGYSVGFLNKDGTDLGFLRGNVTGPTGCTVENDKITTGNHIVSHEAYDDVYQYARYSGSFTFDSTVTSIDVTATWYDRGSYATGDTEYELTSVLYYIGLGSAIVPQLNINSSVRIGRPVTETIKINSKTFKLYIAASITNWFVHWLGSMKFTLIAYDSTGSYTYESPTYDFEKYNSSGSGDQG